MEVVVLYVAFSNLLNIFYENFERSAIRLLLHLQSCNTLVAATRLQHCCFQGYTREGLIIITDGVSVSNYQLGMTKGTEI